MRKNLKTTALPFLVLGAGGTGLVLRVLLYTYGTDDRGLLPRFHPLHLLTLLLTAAVAVLVVLAVRELPAAERYRDNFPASPIGGGGTFAAALFLLLAAFSLLGDADDLLSIARTALAFLSVLCLCITGFFRLKGRRPNFWLHGVVCVYLLVHLLCRYRVWSGEPQTVDYLYPLLASICLAFTAYSRTAFDVRMGRQPLYMGAALLAVYFCFLAMVGAEDGRYYFGFGLWAFANLFPIAPALLPEVE